jgi:hypothetical protein
LPNQLLSAHKVPILPKNPKRDSNQLLFAFFCFVISSPFMKESNEQSEGLAREYEDAATIEKVERDHERSKVNDFSEYYNALVEQQ